MSDTPQQILDEFLESRGLKHTRQRKVITEEFFRSNKHLRIEELLSQVKKTDPSIGYVTVYRTLMLLKECGLAHQRNFGEGQSLFEKAGDHHDHMICIKCGSITEFEDDRIEELQEQIAKKKHFKIVSHRHEIYGCCSRCQKE